MSVAALIAAVTAAGAAGVGAVPGEPHARIVVPEDTVAIRRVVDEFMAAIAAKDGKRLSALVLHSRILFSAIQDQAGVESVRAFDSRFDGIGAAGFGSFARFVSTTKDRIREDFRNVEISQDGPLAWVVFDYEFIANDRVENYGVEHWQLRRTDGTWKIFSVTWTQYVPDSTPKAKP